MSRYFLPANNLLPKDCDMESWSVIACDQFTSDPAYWNRVHEKADAVPSTLKMIIPEAELAFSNDQTIQNINNCMQQYLDEDIFTEYPDSYVYVERVMLDGSVRQGVIGMVDLEHYHHDPKRHPKISATEKTVMERIPPRVSVRKDAPLEFTHVLMLCDDPTCSVIESLASQKAQLSKLYDFDLMENGGHITGWLVAGDAAKAFGQALERYESNNSYVVGDGNHSLVTAKTCYENLKQGSPGQDLSDHPARYALVELENVHSPALVFEPIHRIIVQTDPQRLLKDMECICAEDGEEITWVMGQQTGTIKIHTEPGELLVGVLQGFLDRWLAENAGDIDYVHGDDSVRQLASGEKTVGFLLPKMKKSILFPYVQAGNILPRKMFSMGHGSEKRYYLEGRKIR